MMLRYARWAAVSTAEQAKKISIKVQLEKGEEAAHKHGWVETCPPFVVPGESRTRFISLYHAEKEIPQLHAMLEAAEQGRFDVLYVYDLNRFRNLMRQVFDVLCDYNIQIYVGAYPRDPVTPEEYDDEQKAAVGMIVDLANIISRSEIGTLRRHFREKMPKRVTEKGLHAGTGMPPYGYRKPAGQESKEAVLEPDPMTAPVVIRIKDEFTAGKSMRQIASNLNDEGVPSSYGGRWHVSTIQYILTNPFYAGVTTWGKTVTVRNRREGYAKKVKQKPTARKRGAHTPLWDEKTHKTIMGELNGRRESPYPTRRTHTFSNLLFCAACGKKLRIFKQKFYTDRNDYGWYCTRHVFIRNSDLTPKFIRAFVELLQTHDTIVIQPPEDKRPALLARRRELEKRRARWMEAFETGEIDSRKYSDRVGELEQQIKSVDDDLARAEEAADLASDKADGYARFRQSIEAVPHYIEHGDQQELNHLLKNMISGIVVSGDKEIEIKI